MKKREEDYDYVDVNEAVIADGGFEKAYDVRRKMDVLKISPQITFTMDEKGKKAVKLEVDFHNGDGNNFGPWEREHDHH